MKYIKVEVFVPKEDKGKIIDGLNQRQVLNDKGYDSVFAQSEVLGHFRPLAGSNPNKGSIGKLEKVDEVKLEFRIDANRKDEVFEIIRKNHPYEVPIINFIELL